MRLLRVAPRNDRPSLMPAPRDREAERLRADYLRARYGAPDDHADAIVAAMDIPTQTLLAIEMKERERDAWTADYDPFGAF